MRQDDYYLSPILQELVPRITYKPYYPIYLMFEQGDDGSGGWHLFVISTSEDSMRPGEKIRVRHGFLVPAASYNEVTWMSWVFERIREVETHEAGEFFKVDDKRVFAPHHSNGENPYIVWHVGDYATAAKKSGDE